jgi:hypothetical protein
MKVVARIDLGFQRKGLIPETLLLSAEAYDLYQTWGQKLSRATWNLSEIDRLIIPKVLGMVLRLVLLLHVLESILKALESHLPARLPLRSSRTGKTI